MKERKCPKCDSIIIYKSHYSRNYAEKIGSKCFKCGQKDGGLKRKKHTKYEKSCPICNVTIKYRIYSSLSYSIKNNVACKKCRDSRYPDTKERNCPKCNKIINYYSKWARHLAEKNNAKCKECCANDPDRIASQSAKVSGKNNYFYQKTHSEETKAKLSEISKRIWRNKSLNDKETWKTKCIRVGNKNGMYGKSVYQRWVELYGTEEANKRLLESNKKKSINGLGKRLGYSPHHSCGRGWKGRYKGIYFRSLGELSYMIFLDENNIEWKCAETKEFMIKYINDKGNQATYKPDFIIENRKIVEIKPKALQNTKLNQLKAKAAMQFCNAHSLEYEMIDVKNNLEKIKLALDSKLIEFSKDFENKFLEFYNKKTKT